MVRTLLFLLFLPAAFAQPALWINNAANSMSSRMARIAPRSLIQVRLEPSGVLAGRQPAPALDLHQPLALTIQPADASAPLAAEILSATSFDVIAVLPADLPLGEAAMTLTYNGGAASTGTVEIAAASFALFTLNYGFGPAVAQNVNPGSPIELNGLTRPALPGSYVTLWGTGLGHTAPDDVAVLLDGRAVPVQFAGPSPSLAGLDQINIFVPFDAGMANSCYVPLRVEVLGEPSNPASISKADVPGPCSHPLGLSEQQLLSLDEGGDVPIGRVGIYSVIGPPNPIGPPAVSFGTLVRFERSDASFFATDAGGVARFSSRAAAGPSACSSSRSLIGVIGIISAGGGLNVGDSVTVSGPESRSLELPTDRLGFTFYSHSLEPTEPVDDPGDLPPPFFTAGEWEISAPGSSGVEAFRVAVRLPRPVDVTNFQQLRTVDRAAGMSITWKADGYTEADTMLVQFQGGLAAAGESTASNALSIECRVAALEGHVTIEPQLLQEFDASQPGLPAMLSLSVNGPPEDESRFTVELSTGEAIPGVVSYGLAESFPVDLQ
jgi:uncharacterized protein (TIGR03437 family)